jgi:8-amino-7-oxononanoate synthase
MVNDVSRWQAVPMEEPFSHELDQLRARSLLRQLREIGSAQGPSVKLVGQHLVNFSSNDYLGLAADERLCAAATQAIKQFGVGAGASRLISGTQSPHVALERAIAKWKNAPAAIAFNSGYAAAVGTLPAIAGKNDVIVLDKLAHASLVDGARLSGASIRVFPHNHLGKLESHLEWARREKSDARIIVVTESVFSMDGDRAPLREIVELKSRFQALLLLDEAHAVGVLGPGGCGLVAEEKLSADIQMGTLSKALGAAGGYVCGSASLIEWLTNRARSLIYSTAPPAAIAAAAIAAIEFLQTPEGEDRRRALWKNIELLHQLFASETNRKPESAIFPFLVGQENDAMSFAHALQKEGFFVPAIRYPSVARGSARLRITLTAAHTESQIRALVDAIRKLQRSSGRH